MKWLEDANIKLATTIEKIEDVLLFDLEKFRESAFWAGDVDKDPSEDDDEDLSNSPNNTKS